MINCFSQKFVAFHNKIVDVVCSGKKHIVSLPYVKDFSKKKIPTKARPIQMNAEILDFCQKEFLIYLLRV
jgi:hypothetical protein